jgi:4-amino-4-deoxy-L-arabinose transferase-like glycosyltransferase
MVVAVLACLALGALSLLVQESAPSYDPWAWIIWGREITQLDLDTVDGPSWKPLPVFFTTLFAPLGDAAPALWLVVARAGTFGALLVAFRLARRLGGVAAGVGAVALLVASTWLYRNAALGNSEGLLILFVLWAVERHLARRRTQAFALGLGAALLRPEAWPFLGLYALWLLWEERTRRRWAVVLGGLATLPVLWLLPEYWGSGNFWRAAERANTPNPDSPAFAEVPSLAVLDSWALLMAPVSFGGLLLAALAGPVGFRPPGRGRETLALVALAAGWIVLVAAMTEAGYSGNERYLLAPCALLYCVAAAGFAWTGGAILRWARARRREGLGRVALAVATAGLVFATVEWTDNRMPRAWADIGYQARMAHETDDAIAAAGGRERVLACGTPYTNEFLVPLVAWNLGIHGREVGLEPERRAVMFQAAHVLGGKVDPPPDSLAGRPDRRLAARTEHWRVEFACGSAPSAAAVPG